jgi:DNA-binding NarL/FixJ family response regulator
MSKPSVRILLVDDHEVVRRGVRTLLEMAPGFEICGECADGRQAVELAQSLSPDVLIMDLTLPKLNGCEATRQVIRARSAKGVLILTMDDSEEMLRRALQAGAAGYVLKTDGGSELIEAVRVVGSGKKFFSACLAGPAKRALEEGTGSESGSTDDGLTRREREVLQLLAEGRTNKKVAEILKISIKTSETHRARIMRKLGAESVADLVRYAIRNKIVRP